MNLVALKGKLISRRNRSGQESDNSARNPEKEGVVLVCPWKNIEIFKGAVQQLDVEGSRTSLHETPQGERIAEIANIHFATPLC